MRRGGSEITSGPEDGHIYYNATLVNNTTSYIQAQISETRTTAIIDNPADYFLSVARFYIPSNAIPIFYFQPNTYYITLTYNNVDYQQVLLNDSNNLLDSTYTGVYAYDQFLDSVNAGFTGAYSALIAANPGLTGVTGQAPPYIYYDNNSGLFTVVANKYLFDITQSNPIQIWFNQYLHEFFTTFRWRYDGYGNANKKDLQLYVYPGPNNMYISGDNINTVQYATSQGSWNDIVSLVITTTGLPTVGEYITKNASINSGSQSGSLKILTDFETLVQNGTIDVNPTSSVAYQYAPSLYRLINLQGNNSINSVDLTVYWKDKYNVLHQHILSPGEYMSIKLVFIKKNPAKQSS